MQKVLDSENTSYVWERLSADGSLSAYNANFDECYHSLKDGALNESFYKHIYPSLCHLGTQAFKIKSSLNTKDFQSTSSPLLGAYAYLASLSLPSRFAVLDICFGLGYNSLLLLATLAKINYQGEVHIYSPELDYTLFERLLDFQYPLEITRFIPHLHTLLQGLCEIKPNQSGSYRGEIGKVCYEIILHKGDAFDFLTHLEAKLSFSETSSRLDSECNGFDIVYQDAFSPKKNPTLWSEAYFSLLSKLLKSQGIVTTYSQARAVREAAYKSGLLAYDYHSPLTRTSTLFARAPITLAGTKRRL